MLGVVIVIALILIKLFYEIGNSQGDILKRTLTEKESQLESAKKFQQSLQKQLYECKTELAELNKIIESMSGNSEVDISFTSQLLQEIETLKKDKIKLAKALKECEKFSLPF